MSKRWCKWSQDRYPLTAMQIEHLTGLLDTAYCVANGITTLDNDMVSPRQDWINAHNERKEQENQE